ncbi:hypothetical protein [Marinobacter sp. W-8]|uniref:hypothetical protein n=1 Tax=Marinobacter sp. W-8 TaxID=3369658 RepID=UPI0037C7623D
MRLITLILVSVLLVGCQTVYVYPDNPFPADLDLEDCVYPMRASDDDAALGDAYVQALGQIELCNGRLEGVRKAKKAYMILAD